MTIYKPLEITANRSAKMLKIIWDDQHESIYPFSLLRAACPCAECRGGHAKMGSTPDPIVFKTPIEDCPACRIEALEAVGTYAITIKWQDGHQYGIYNWGYLRALCPCSSCQSHRAQA